MSVLSLYSLIALEACQCSFIDDFLCLLFSFLSRQDVDKFALFGLPVGEDVGGFGTAGVIEMICDEGVERDTVMATYFLPFITWIEKIFWQLVLWL